MTEFNGAKAAVFIGEKLLVYRRDIKPGLAYPGLWDFPGGGREGAETPEETLFREIDEEFGLKPGPETIRWSHAFHGIDGMDHQVWFFVLSLSKGSEEAVVFGDEGQEWRLMTWDEFSVRSDVVPIFHHRLNRWFKETGGAL